MGAEHPSWNSASLGSFFDDTSVDTIPTEASLTFSGQRGKNDLLDISWAANGLTERSHC